MLRFSATNDGKVLDTLSMEIFGDEFPGKVGYVLYDGDKAIGVAKMTVGTEVSVLERVGIVPEERKKGNGDFFTRSLVFGMSNASEEVVVNTKDEYYCKFGFTERNGKMVCPSGRVVFPCGCHK